MELISRLKNLFTTSPKVKSLIGLSGIERTNAILANLVAERKVPGIAVTILKNGQVLLQKGYGHSNLETRTSVNPKTTFFRIASISKSITGMALGKMVAEGILDLDASFYDYVPYYPEKRHDFTIRQLAGHTAGIRAYKGKEYALDKPYSIKDSIKVFKDDPLVFEPGKGYLYNSFDFVLLSLAMQEASGVSFENYVQEKILEPLEMIRTVPEKVAERNRNDGPKESSIANGREKVAERSRSYTKTATGFKTAVSVDNYYKLAGGGYLSTSDDIAKFGQAILDKKLLNPETYDHILTPQMVNGKSTYYGLGFQVSEDEIGRNFLGHVGSSVGAYTNFFVYPEEEVVIAILINCTDPKIQGDLDDAIDSVVKQQ